MEASPLTWYPARIVQSSALLPELRVSSASLISNLHLTRVAKEKLQKKTIFNIGIFERRYTRETEATSDIAAQAVRPLLSHPVASAVQNLILATTSPDSPSPATAHRVHSKLRLSSQMLCFDVSSSCTSFLSALRASVAITEDNAASVVVASEVKHRVLDPHNANTSLLFGDGAGALLLHKGWHGEAFAFPFIATENRLVEHIGIEGGGSRFPDRKPFLHLQEPRLLFREIVKNIVTAIECCWQAKEQALLQSGAAACGGLIFIHQANRGLLQAVKDKLPPDISDRIVICMGDTGNLISASVPVLRTRALQFVCANENRVIDSAAPGGPPECEDERVDLRHAVERYFNKNGPNIDIWVAAGGGFQTVGVLHASRLF